MLHNLIKSSSSLILLVAASIFSLVLIFLYLYRYQVYLLYILYRRRLGFRILHILKLFFLQNDEDTVTGGGNGKIILILIKTILG